jgi:4-hydroxy-tetrahydrodipicolinate reductase
MMKVCLVGASGRMGSLLQEAIARAVDCELRSVLVRNRDSLPPADWANIIVTSDLKEAVLGADIVIDFSSPSISQAVVEVCSSFGVPLLLGTTGHTPAQREALSTVVPRAPLLFAPNTSVGVFVLGELARAASQMLGEGFDMEIFELHHRAKLDAPSGTARLLGEALAGSTGLVDRTAGGAREPLSVGGASLRGGDVPGEHTVFFLGSGERLELIHRVRDRSVFADGALRLARELIRRPPGVYSVRDIVRP